VLQVFFAPDVTDREWMVVIQKESRSKRQEGEDCNVVLGAPGRAMQSMRVDDILHSPELYEAEVNEAYVRVIDADREPTNNRRQFEHYDWVDDDDDEDVRAVVDDDWDDLEGEDLGV
jgi:hypothetical protein